MFLTNTTLEFLGVALQVGDVAQVVLKLVEVEHVSQRFTSMMSTGIVDVFSHTVILKRVDLDVRFEVVFQLGHVFQKGSLFPLIHDFNSFSRVTLMSLAPRCLARHRKNHFWSL